MTEKTVFNHFPTKEALLADRWERTINSLCTQLGDPAVAPLDTALAVLEAELVFFTTPSLQPGTSTLGSTLGQVSRFRDLVRTTPSLLAHEYQALDRLRGAAAEALAQRRAPQRKTLKP